jgi:hypothetical protein
MICQAIGDLFIVDTPTTEVGPRLLGAALHRESDGLEHYNGSRELRKG